MGSAMKAPGTILAILLLAGCAATDRARVTTGGTAVAYSGPLCGSDQPSQLDIVNRTDHEVDGRCWVRLTTEPDGTTVRESGIEISAKSSASAAMDAAIRMFESGMGMGLDMAERAARFAAPIPVP